MGSGADKNCTECVFFHYNSSSYVCKTCVGLSNFREIGDPGSTAGLPAGALVGVPQAHGSAIERAMASASQVGGDHYKSMPVEPWDVIDTWPVEQRIGYYRGNLLKYTMRMGSKDASAQEIAKAEHYAQKLQEVLKEQAGGRG